MVPTEELPRIFKLGGLRYIDDSSIPQELKQSGWEAQVWQKDVSDGTLIMQVIIGPNQTGEPVGRRTDVLQLLPNGKVSVHWDQCEHGDLCAELFDACPLT
jgi:hypothetical protein